MKHNVRDILMKQRENRKKDQTRPARKTYVTSTKRIKLKLYETLSKRSNRREDQTQSARDTTITIALKIKHEVSATLTSQSQRKSNTRCTRH